MKQDKLLSMLGLCRRAGRLQWGHDTCLGSIRQGRAKVCLLSSDASDRLRREMRRAADEAGGTPDVLDTPYTMQQFKDAAGCFAGVLTTEDAGFADRLAALYREQTREEIANDQ